MAVGDGVGVRADAGVLVTVEWGVRVLIGVHELQALGAPVGVFVGRLVRFDVRCGRGVRVALSRVSCACPMPPVTRIAASAIPTTALLAVNIARVLSALAPIPSDA